MIRIENLDDLGNWIKDLLSDVEDHYMKSDDAAEYIILAIKKFFAYVGLKEPCLLPDVQRLGLVAESLEMKRKHFLI